MKTAAEWLQELKEPYKSAALNNLKIIGSRNAEYECEDLPKAVSSCFAWSNTPEGYPYWSDLWFYLSKGQYPPIEIGRKL